MISTTSSIQTYTSDGVTLPWTVPFPFLAHSDIIVSKIHVAAETILVEGVDYALTGGDPNGTVTLTVAVTNGDTIKIKRVLALTQLIDFSSQFNNDPASITKMGDRITMILQQMNDGSISGSFVHGNLGGAAEGTYHATAVYNGNAGFLSGSLRKTYDDHVVNTANPHSTTAAQVSAAPASHVMSTDSASTGHPLATTSLPGFMSAADKTLLGTLGVNDPRAMFIEQFDGSDLAGHPRWTKNESAGAGTYLSLTTDAAGEDGVLEITTPAVGSSVCGIYTKARGPKTTRNFAYAARIMQAVHSGSTARWGMCDDYSARAPTHFFLFFFDGANLNVMTAGGGAATSSTVSGAPTDAQFYEYGIIVSGLGTAVDYYINGASVAHHTTNMPSTSKPLNPFIEVVPTGAAAKKLAGDYVFWTYIRVYT